MLDKSNCSRGETHLEYVGQLLSTSENDGQAAGAWSKHGEGEEEVTGEAIRARFRIVRPPTAYVAFIVTSERYLAPIAHPMSKLMASRESLATTP